MLHEQHAQKLVPSAQRTGVPFISTATGVTSMKTINQYCSQSRGAEGPLTAKPHLCLFSLQSKTEGIAAGHCRHTANISDVLHSTLNHSYLLVVLIYIPLPKNPNPRNHAFPNILTHFVFSKLLTERKILLCPFSCTSDININTEH